VRLRIARADAANTREAELCFDDIANLLQTSIEAAALHWLSRRIILITITAMPL
jgi:hypothetical protein